MKTARFPLWTKVLFIAFLNLCLLALALGVIMRAQFRVDSGSFLLAPAQSRIMALAQEIALELDESPRESWDEVLARHSREQQVEFTLLDEFGQHVAGPDVALPKQVADRVPHRPKRRQQASRRSRPEEDRPPEPDRGPGPEKGPRQPSPPLFLTATVDPVGYWAGARVPVREDRLENPHPGTLLMSAPSLLTSRLFFDIKPWVAIGLAVIVISVACWLPFIRGLTRSISRLTQAAGQIAEGQFQIHVESRRRDEIGQLGVAVNRMAERLSAFVNGQKAFLRGIAHELCTPIATIQFGMGNLERRVDERQREALAEIQEEVQHMSALVNELLQFSRGGLDLLNVKQKSVNVRSTVERVLDRESAEGTEITVAVDSSINVLAEPEYLFRALSNVVRNAVRYAGQAGPIRIETSREALLIVIAVTDSGPGVPSDSLEQIFEPFYRLDASRNRETGGMGLGLAIVKTCVEACGGRVSCENAKPCGLKVEIRLPEAGVEM